MCTVLLPPGVNSTAVNKYININIKLKLDFIKFNSRNVQGMA